jgi:crossover junction endodeoxyribonuclease RusA
MQITLPYPPSANRIWRAVDGRVILSAEGRGYRHRVASALIDQHAAIGFVPGITRPPTFDWWFSIEIDAWMPDRRRRDIDNLAKPVIDALKAAGVYRDDSQAVRLVATRRGFEPPNGRLVVTITQSEMEYLP